MPTLETVPQFTVLGDSILNVGRVATERSVVRDNVIRATNQSGQTVELPQVSAPSHLHLDSRAEHPALSAMTTTFDKDLRSKFKVTSTTFDSFEKRHPDWYQTSQKTAKTQVANALKDFKSLPESLFESVEFPPLDQQSIASLTNDVETGLITSGDTAKLKTNVSHVQKPYLNERQQLVKNPARDRTVRSWHAENIKDKFVKRKSVERYSTSGDPFVRNRERMERQHHTIIPRPQFTCMQAVNRRVAKAKANNTSMLSESTHNWWSGRNQPFENNQTSVGICENTFPSQRPKYTSSRRHDCYNSLIWEVQQE